MCGQMSSFSLGLIFSGMKTSRSGSSGPAKRRIGARGSPLLLPPPPPLFPPPTPCCPLGGIGRIWCPFSPFLNSRGSVGHILLSRLAFCLLLGSRLGSGARQSLLMSSALIISELNALAPSSIPFREPSAMEGLSIALPSNDSEAAIYPGCVSIFLSGRQ